MSPSFGPTCAGRTRKAALLIVVGLTLSMLSLLQAGSLPSALGQSGPTAATSAPTSSATYSVPLSLGFSPSTLSSVSSGTPVYTVGDTIWALSGYNYSVPISVTSAKVNSSVSTDIVASVLLDPQVITPLFTFGSGDVDGLWNITIGSMQGAVIVPVRFVNLAAHPISLGPLAYTLDGGSLSISTQANLGDTYDQQVCAAGVASSRGVTTSLPAGLGETGNITIVPGDPISIDAVGKNITKPFSFWFDLYHPYALDVTTANSLVVNDLDAASSQPVTFSGSGNATTTLTWSLPMREGRYELRTYFQNSTSLQVVQSNLLILNSSSWISLTNSCLPQTVTAPAVSYSASLTRGPQNWPSTIYIMYRAFGVEGVASYPLKANLSSVSFISSPWNRTITDVKVNVSPRPGVQTSQDGSSLFVLSQYVNSTNLDYSLDISGGQDVAQSSVTVPPDTALTTSLSLAKLTVNVVSDQTSATTLEVTGPNGLNITGQLIGANQTMSFILPTGSYSIAATQAGNTQSAQVRVTDGAASSATINFNTLISFEIILIVTAAMAAIANVVVWIRRSRSLGSKLASNPWKQP